MIWAVLAAALSAYLLGNLNGSVCISALVAHDDVRKHGSGNAGLTNYFRTYGGVQSLLVIVIDVVKCVAACLIAQWLLPGDAFHAKMVAGASCILGHCFPAAAGFRGGKGIEKTRFVCVASTIYHILIGRTLVCAMRLWLYIPISRRTIFVEPLVDV